MRRRAFIIGLGVAALASPGVANSDADAIRHLLNATFDKPDARLTVDPVVVAGEHAIAGWSQGGMGGRALLRRRAQSWQLVLCSGDQLKSAQVLVQVGVAADAAPVLAARLAEAERTIAPERLAEFSKFDGIVMMDAAGHHPPQHSSHHTSHK